MKRLENKVAVITGGNSGIGFAAAQAFVAEGARVVIFGRDARTLAQAAELLGPSAVAVRGDVTNDADLAQAFAAAVRAFGKVDVVFANAGVAEFLPIEAVTDEHVTKLLDINVRGVLKTVQQALPVLSRGASIIITSSAANELGLPGASVYAATKAAARSLARTLSAELVERGIRVNSISPGPVATPIFGRMGMSAAQIDATTDHMTGLVPLKRVSQADEISPAIVFLASDESSYMVGADIVVDGGMSQL